MTIKASNLLDFFEQVICMKFIFCGSLCYVLKREPALSRPDSPLSFVREIIIFRIKWLLFRISVSAGRMELFQSSFIFQYLSPSISPHKEGISSSILQALCHSPVNAALLLSGGQFVEPASTMMRHTELWDSCPQGQMGLLNSFRGNLFIANSRQRVFRLSAWTEMLRRGMVCQQSLKNFKIMLQQPHVTCY